MEGALAPPSLVRNYAARAQPQSHKWPDLPRHKLADCCAAAGVENDESHHALGDARAALALFLMLAETATSPPLDASYLLPAGWAGVAPTGRYLPRPAKKPRAKRTPVA